MEESSNNGRHTLWFTTAAFSTIALVAITKSIGDITDQEKEIKWAVSAVSIPLALSGLAVFANLLLKDKFIGTFMEGGLALLTCGFWAAGMPTIMDPDNLLAVRGAAREINNNNLYFFSWGAFLMSFFVLFGFVKDAHGRGGTAATKANRCEAWAGLLATSFVMMIASSRIFDDSNCDKDQTIDLADDVCKRVKFAVALGAVSSMTSALWIMVGMFIKGRVGIMIDTMLSWLLFVMWILGITYLTFGDKAPAQTLGNLYFFTWASFGISVTMAMSSFKAMLGSMRGETAEPPKLEPKEEIKEGQEMQEEEMGMGEMSA